MRKPAIEKAVTEIFQQLQNDIKILGFEFQSLKHDLLEHRGEIKYLEISNSTKLTLEVLEKFGPSTATQVSNVTHRSRAIESKNLNELKRAGALEMRRDGQSKIFFIKPEALPKIRR